MSQRYVTPVFSKLVLLACIAMSPVWGFGQRIDTIFGCDDIPTSPLEAAACSICNFDILYGTSFPFTPSVDAGWCGTIENDQYIGFVAGPTGSVVFEMQVFGCMNNQGLQVGIYDGSNSLVGTCFNQVSPGIPQIFTAGGLTPGNVYYLRIDGFSGDGCEFKIQAISGLISSGPGAPGPILGPPEVCWDETYPYAVAPVSNATGYYWRLTPGVWTLGATIDPPEATNPLVGTSYLGIDLEVPPMSLGMPPGTCDNILLEVFPLNPCFTGSDSSVFNVRVCRPLQDTTIVELCPGERYEFPSGSGIFFGFSNDYQTVDVGPGANGCDTFGVLLTIPQAGQYVDTLDRMGSYTACESGYIYPPNGQLFTAGVHYFPANDTSSATSCDTAIALTVIQTTGPPLMVSITGDGVICDTATSVTAVIQSGTPPFIFEWSTGDRDSATLSSTVDGLVPGFYSLMVSDSIGCTLDTTFVIEDFLDALPDLQILPVDCFGDGGSAILTGAITTSLDIQWSTGATSDRIDGLTAGQYGLTVSLPNSTCRFDTTFMVSVDTTCYVVIEGYVSSDVTIDCNAPQAAFSLDNVEVMLNGSQSAFTDQSGYYSFRVDTGTYDVTAVNPYPNALTPTCTLQHTVSILSLQAAASRADFYYLRDSISDIKLNLYKTPASVGRSSTLIAEVCSDNALDQLVDITLSYDSDKQRVIWTRPTASQVTTNPGLIVFPDVIAPAFGCTTLMVGLLTDASVPVGDTLTFYGWTDSLTTQVDATPDDNRDTAQTVVLASYDPNVKLVQPAGQGDSNLISRTDTLLEYTIIFQNTGTDDALLVRVEDQFVPELNPETFKPLAASHPYLINLEDDNKLTVTFDDIRLSPMSEDFEGSKGFFTFQIELEKDLPEGAEITNVADIFFDFNAPIRTTIARVMLPRNEVVITEPTVDTPRVRGVLLLYPNPARDFLIAQAPTGDSVLTLQLTSVEGKVFPLDFIGGDATKGNQRFSLTNRYYPSGIYFARIELLSGRVEYRKVVVDLGY